MIQKSLDFGDEVFIQNMSIPVWRADIEYQEGALVVKGDVLAKYWRDRKSWKLVWLSVDNAEQYDMFLN